MKTGVELIADERKDQIERLDRTVEKDVRASIFNKKKIIWGI